MINDMRQDEFNSLFEIDRNSKGIRATEKLLTEPEKAVVTADGKLFNPGQTYYFVDKPALKIRDTKYMRRVDRDNLGDLGTNLVLISRLRESKDDAIEELENYVVKTINDLRDRLRDLMADKTPAGRTLKYILAARG